MFAGVGVVEGGREGEVEGQLEGLLDHIGNYLV